MLENKISDFTLESIQTGKAILFLGSGATIGSIEGGKSKPLNGYALRDEISDKFLGGALKEKTLAQVAEIAKSESSLFQVQEFIKEQFEDLKPAAFHKLIPAFRWHAIVTTNYDFIIERAYTDASIKRQNLFRLLGDNDDFAEVAKDVNSVPFLKLHGCLSKVRDEKLPLILASEEYAKYKENRSSLFRLFSDWARQYPILFCGYDLSDPNVTQILYDIGDDSINRPRHSLIKPNISDHEARYYLSRRIDPFPITLEGFLSYIDDAIPEHKRTLGSMIKNKSLLSKWLQADTGTESEGLSYYLSTELEYISTELGAEGINPNDFYNGMGLPWGVFSQEFDSARNITETLLLEAVLEQELEQKPKLFLLLGYAGSGKSVILRRLVWDSATKYSRLVFVLKYGGGLKREYIEEIWQLTKEPFIVVVEHSMQHLDEIDRIFKYLKRYSIPVNLIIEARTNEWNVAGDSLDKLVSKSFEVIDMTGTEIQLLLEKLEKFKCLGALTEVPKDQREEHLKVSADRQLLVALLEATQGDPLEKIVLNEYSNITPNEARVLYLDVCTLHRFGISARSGLISRISNINFNYFSSRLLKPLEHVVRTFVDYYSRDNAYTSRHQEIARIIFDHVLDTPERKVDQIVRLISNMNVDYQSDSQAFDKMIRGHLVAEAFANKAFGERIYAAARRSGANESYIKHQQAVFELNHPNGDYRKALTIIDNSYRTAKHGQKSIKHTKALILRRLAQNESEGLLKDKYRVEAKLILKQQLKLKDSSYSFSALLNLLLDELKERFFELESLPDVHEYFDRVSEELIAEIEDILYRGTQENPGDDVLLGIESKYAELIGETPRAIKQIEAAYNRNPNSTYNAISLAKIKEKNDGFKLALDILNDAIDRNPTSKQLHLNVAKLCIRFNEKEHHQFIDTHLRKSFSDGDSNYEAQYWYARQNYLYGDKNKSNKIYLFIKESKLPSNFKDKKRGVVLDLSGNVITYYGLIFNKSDSYCFASCAEIPDNVFIHYSEFPDGKWDKCTPDSKLTFQLGFSLSGPIGLNADLTDTD